MWFDYCPIPEFVRIGKLSKKWTCFYCDVANPVCKRYQLENFGRNIPDNMLPDGKIQGNLTRFND
ncbi:MAG: uracil-DNA glycosylase [Candidatus Aureabacteria bacterium]|nr:uracil-DNA glycosylase [Candidatus Auribacterota bacterium]